MQSQSLPFPTSTIPLAADLVRYLQAIAAPSPFRLGHWLSSLTDEQLQLLSSKSDRWEAGEASPHTDDVVGVVAVAFGAETGLPPLDLKAENFGLHHEALRIAIGMEVCVRAGWLVMHDATSIQPANHPRIEVTALGLGKDWNAS